jgi:hypothetical protein
MVRQVERGTRGKDDPPQDLQTIITLQIYWVMLSVEGSKQVLPLAMHWVLGHHCLVLSNVRRGVNNRTAASVSDHDGCDVLSNDGQRQEW